MDMGFCGPEADIEPTRDVLVRQAGAYKAQNLKLARGEQWGNECVRRFHASLTVNSTQQAAGNAGRTSLFTMANLVYHRNEFLDRCGIRDVARDSHFSPREHVCFGLTYAQDNQTRVRRGLVNPNPSLGPSWERDIDQDNVRMCRAYGVECAVRRRGFSSNTQPPNKPQDLHKKQIAETSKTSRTVPLSGAAGHCPGSMTQLNEI
jgi:hypothetical protein